LPAPQATLLYNFLLNDFMKHADFSIERIADDKTEHFRINLGDSDVPFLSVRDGDPLLLTFFTKCDLHKIRKVRGLEQSPYGRMFELSGRSYQWMFDTTVGIDANCVVFDDVFEALLKIAETSRMQNIVPRDGDPPIKAQIRRYCLADGEWEHNTLMGQLVNSVDETNLDYVVDSILEIDPWVDEDPDSALGTIHILLEKLVREEHRCLTQATHHLRRLRSKYEKFGPRTDIDVQELDTLLEFVNRQTH